MDTLDAWAAKVAEGIPDGDAETVAEAVASLVGAGHGGAILAMCLADPMVAATMRGCRLAFLLEEAEWGRFGAVALAAGAASVRVAEWLGLDDADDALAMAVAAVGGDWVSFAFGQSWLG